MFVKILPGLADFLFLLVVVIATRPGTFRYTRSLGIAAPPEVLFAQVNDLHKFQDWNPWSKIDPAAVMTWSMYGPDNFMGIAIGLFFDFDKMCGDQFAKGLATLKSLAETAPGA